MTPSGTRLAATALLALIAAGAAPAQEPPAAIGDALALAERGDLAGAVAALERQVAEPNAPDMAFAALGALLLETGSAERALEVLAPLADRDPPDPAALFNAGRAAEALSRFQDAAAYYQRSVEVEPRSPALRALGQVLSALGRREEAEVAIRRFQDLTAATSTLTDPVDAGQRDPDDPTGHAVRQALQRAGSGDANGALEALAREGRLAPDDPRPAIAASSVLLHAGRSDEALAAVAQALDLAPGNPDGLYQRGVVLMSLKELGPAEEMFRQVLQASPTHTATLSDYAVLLMSQGRENEAARHLRSVLELRPDDPLARRHLEQLEEDPAPAGGGASAVQSLRRAVELDPDDADAWARLGDALLLERSFRAAEEPLRRAVELDPSNVSARIALASALWESNQPAEAERHADEAATLLPTSPAPHRLLGAILLWRGEYVKAAESLERSAALAGPDAELQLELARAWEGAAGQEPTQAQDRLTRAEAAYRRATALAPEHHEAVYGLAQVLQRLGRTEEAAAQMARYQTLYDRDRQDTRERGRASGQAPGSGEPPPGHRRR